MSREDKPYVIAIGGGVAFGLMGLIALFSLLTYSYELYERIQVVRTVERCQRDNFISAVPDPLPSDTRRTAGAATPCQPVANSPEDEAAAELRDLSYRDIDAQEGMNRAAQGMLIATLIQLIVGITSIFLIRDTLRETKRTADIADEHGRRQMRAYISATPAYLFSFGVGQRIEIKFTVQNHGQTPGHDTKHGATVFIERYPLPRTFQVPDFNASSTPYTAHPTQATDGNVVGPIACTAQDIADLIHQTKRIYVIGRIEYRDAFGEQRWTNFFRSVVADEAAWISLTNGSNAEVKLSFQIEPSHNDSN